MPAHIREKVLMCTVELFCWPCETESELCGGKTRDIFIDFHLVPATLRHLLSIPRTTLCMHVAYDAMAINVFYSIHVMQSWILIITIPSARVSAMTGHSEVPR